LEAGKFVFPEAEDVPAGAAKNPVDATVTGAVGGEFTSPERGVALGLGAVAGAAVPETAVHKNGDAPGAEKEVGPDAKTGGGAEELLSPPTGEVEAAEEAGEDEFGVAVAPAADAGHDFGTLAAGEDVGHGLLFPTGFINISLCVGNGAVRGDGHGEDVFIDGQGIDKIAFVGNELLQAGDQVVGNFFLGFLFRGEDDVITVAVG